MLFFSYSQHRCCCSCSGFIFFYSLPPPLLPDSRSYTLTCLGLFKVYV